MVEFSKARNNSTTSIGVDPPHPTPVQVGRSWASSEPCCNRSFTNRRLSATELLLLLPFIAGIISKSDTISPPKHCQRLLWAIIHRLEPGAGHQQPRFTSLVMVCWSTSILTQLQTGCQRASSCYFDGGSGVGGSLAIRQPYIGKTDSVLSAGRSMAQVLALKASSP